MFDVFGSSGQISGGVMSDGGGGTTFDVTTGQGLIRTIDDHDAPLCWISWAARFKRILRINSREANPVSARNLAFR